MDYVASLHTVVIVAGMAAATVVGVTIAEAVYNVFFHPLARFPGPRLWAATRLGYVARIVQGRLSSDSLALHRKYGPVVRIAPNELAFFHPDAWKDIYGHKAPGAPEFPKYNPFYRSRGIPLNIVSEDRENHALLRRQLAHGFSERSMRGQEPIIGEYVDLLIQRLREHCADSDKKDERTGKPLPKPLNMTAWYNWTTFDIIGDLAFGEPFGGLERAEYHPWVHAIANTISFSAVFLSLKYLGLERLVVMLNRKGQKARNEHMRRSADALTRRMAHPAERPDLIEGLLRRKDGWNWNFGNLQANAATLVLAGSETTATLLTGATYLLLRNPEALKKVTEEVRSTFTSDEEITLLSVGNLSYMLACLDEAFRCFPPVPIGLPRVVPKGGSTIAGHFVPENTIVAVWQWATYHSPEVFADPFGFHPERFLPNPDPKFAGDRLDALQPFSVGPRNCIGRNLAYSEMRLILARLIFNFDMRLADEKNDWISQQQAYLLWQKTPMEVYLDPVKA